MLQYNLNFAICLHGRLSYFLAQWSTLIETIAMSGSLLRSVASVSWWPGTNCCQLIQYTPSPLPVVLASTLPTPTTHSAGCLLTTPTTASTPTHLQHVPLVIVSMSISMLVSSQAYYPVFKNGRYFVHRCCTLVALSPCSF